MSQHDMDVANGPGATVRTDMNSALQALASNNVGPLPPATTFPCQWWCDTTAGKLRRRNIANSAWIDMGALDSLNYLLASGGKLTGPIDDATPQTIASATTTDIGAVTSNVVYISGTTTITGLGTIAAGARRSVRFLSILTLTYNVTSLILPSATSIITAANDTAEFLSLGSGNWICLSYNLASGKMVANPVGTVSQTSGVPTGAIIESGTNAAGTYTKYADGTLICRANPGGIDQVVANTAYSTTFGLPAGFVGAYSIFANVTGVNVGNVFSGYSRAASVTATTYNIIQCWSLVQTYTYSIIAMGRWY